MRTKSNTDRWNLIGQQVAQIASNDLEGNSRLHELVDDLAIAYRQSHKQILLDWHRWLAVNSLSCQQLNYSCGDERVSLRFLQWRHQSIPGNSLNPRISELSSAVVSSHVGRFADWHATWFSNIENAIRRIAGENQHLIVFPKTAAGAWVEQVCARLGVRYEQFDLAPGNTLLVDWLKTSFHRSLVTEGSGSDDPEWCSCFPLSPLRNQETNVRSVDNDFIQDHDFWSVFLPNVVHAIFVRAKGKMERLLNQRLLTSHLGSTRVYPICGLVDHSKPLQRLESLIDMGAVHYIETTLSNPSLSYVPSPASGLPHTLTPIYHGEPWLAAHRAQWSYLAHCTRSRSGRWPDQSERQYLDSVLLGNDEFSSDPLTTLSRILKQKKIVGSSFLIRDSVEVVCWSGQPLDQLLDRRKYQRHLGRWDWEPYGILIHCSLAEKLGAREVTYGPEELLKTLPESERPYFQPHMGGRGKVRHDWAQEREWRTRGDFRLAEVAFEDLIVFVRTQSDAMKISRLSNWPVIYLQN